VNCVPTASASGSAEWKPELDLSSLLFPLSSFVILFFLLFALLCCRQWAQNKYTSRISAASNSQLTVADTSVQTPLLVEEEAPFQNTQLILERTQNVLLNPNGLEIKNDCAGEGQQQITFLLCRCF
jgi:hypothetical protein